MPEFLIAYENNKSEGGIMQFRTTAKRARKTYRQGMNSSILWTVVMWGLNIVDTTIATHLKNFYIDDNLSIKIQASYQHDIRSAVLKFVFSIHK